MATTVLLVILLCKIPSDLMIQEEADVIEVNQFFDSEGKSVFDQIIVRRWNPHESQYDIVDWRIMKGVRK